MGPKLTDILKPYKSLIVWLIFLTITGNALNLVLPKLIARAIDAYGRRQFDFSPTVIEFSVIALLMFVFTYLQSVVQTYASERVARDLRTKLAAKISVQDNAFIQQMTPAKLLTNLTSDMDAVKSFVSLALPSLISSVFLILGASVLLILIDWKLALVVLLVVPIVGGTFFVIMGRVRKLFRKQQEAIDWLNKVINESILGAALIRLLNSHQVEYQKFLSANTEARTVSFGILRLFASLIPLISFATNAATFAILLLGGHFVMVGSLTLGNFTAFNSYIAILIFPLILIGFMSNVIAQAQASYQRVYEILHKEDKAIRGTRVPDTKGDLVLKNVSVIFGEKMAVNNVSFTAKHGTKTAILGPTAAGKTQLLYMLTGLIEPTSGVVEYAGHPIEEYDPMQLHEKIGFVFQESILFNLTLRENIAFSQTVTDATLQKAIRTAELEEFIETLPEKLETVVSERATNFSGGQKQRIMLARALALNPSILLLDDFTARVDTFTEKKILQNVHTNYPDLTLISVTQKVASVEDFDNVILLMEGELLAQGTHKELMHICPEYVQIADSQYSTETYELHT